MENLHSSYADKGYVPKKGPLVNNILQSILPFAFITLFTSLK